VASSDPASAYPNTTAAANISVTATNPRHTQLSMFVMMRVPVDQGTGITEPAACIPGHLDGPGVAALPEFGDVFL
jgi:hypothetical protein